jgi:hypothetical protein
VDSSFGFLYPHILHEIVDFVVEGASYRVHHRLGYQNNFEAVIISRNNY